MRHRQLDIRNPRYTEVEIFECPPGCHIQGAAQNRRGWIQEHRKILGAPSFSPHRIRGFVSPSRPLALRHWLSAIGYFAFFFLFPPNDPPHFLTVLPFSETL